MCVCVLIIVYSDRIKTLVFCYCLLFSSKLFHLLLVCKYSVYHRVPLFFLHGKARVQLLCRQISLQRSRLFLHRERLHTTCLSTYREITAHRTACLLRVISLILFDGWQRIDLFTSEGEGDGIDIFLRSDHGTMGFPS